MDQSERLVHQFLLSQNLGPVCFEPDGNVTPDFSVNGVIGVEVRRLNQNYTKSSGKVEGLEQVWIPLWQRLSNLLSSIGASQYGESWFVMIAFRRPVGSLKSLIAIIEQRLRGFKSSTVRSRVSWEITPNVEIELLPASKAHQNFFVPGGISDLNAGGWVMGEVESNLRLCIAEKERKIAPFRDRYSQWWLVLPDHIDRSMDDEDRPVFLTDVMPGIEHGFDKIILIDPCDHTRWFDLCCAANAATCSESASVQTAARPSPKGRTR